MYRSYLSRNEVSVIRTARWASIPKAMRSRAMPRFESIFAAAELPRLALGQIETAILQELAVVMEASEIPTPGEDHHGQDRGDAG